MELNFKKIKMLKLKRFSVIKSDDEFRSYAHATMKESFGDEYSEELTNKVVDDLLADNKDANYGELIGRLNSFRTK
jgi:hypothetical protein